MEILNTIEEQGKIIINQNEELVKQLKTIISKSASPPQIDIRPIMSGITEKLEESNKSLKSDIFQINYSLEKLNNYNQSRSMFGFTDSKTLLIYTVTILFLFITNLISCENNKASKYIIQQNEEIENLSSQIKSFKMDNPKAAKKYFPME